MGLRLPRRRWYVECYMPPSLGGWARYWRERFWTAAGAVSYAESHKRMRGFEEDLHQVRYEGD